MEKDHEKPFDSIGLICVTASAGARTADVTKREATVGMPSVRTVVSDTNRFTCGSGPVSCLSSDGKRLFVPYLASTSGFGECHDLTALADVPLDRPAAAKSFDILKAGDEFAGAKVKTTVSYTSFLWKGRLRIFLDVNFGLFGYRDWIPRQGPSSAKDSSSAATTDGPRTCRRRRSSTT